nr:hypothetical protein [Candidatus Eremiobacteraeota bacterium]
LADAVEFDRAAAYRNVHEVRPGLPILETSARTGAGISELVHRLEALAHIGTGGYIDAADPAPALSPAAPRPG